MNTAIVIYLLYAMLSIGMTIWVGQTLFRNGLIFVIEAFRGNEELARSVNHLLLVGFYLVNIGFIMLFLRIGSKPVDVVEGIEYIATKLGIVLLVLGAMHFFNMFNFYKMRRKGRARKEAREPEDYVLEPER